MQGMKQFTMKKVYWLLAVCLVLAGSMVMGMPVCAETSGDYTYTVLDDGTVEITGYNGDAETLEIPGTIDGKDVTIIGEQAFFACEGLTKLTIPSSVVMIEKLAFSDCGNLIEMTVPSSVVIIGANVFDNCNVDLTIIAEEDSAAARYAKQNNIKTEKPHVHTPNKDDGDCTTAITCSGCGEIMTAAYSSHTGGTATCAEGAHCDRCGKVYGSKDPDNHVGKTEVRNKKAATSKEEGYTGDTYCVTCGKVISKGKATEMLPIEYVGLSGTNGKEPEEVIVIYKADKTPKIGEKFSVSGLSYKITSVDKKTVSCVGLAKPLTDKTFIMIPQGIEIDNTTYTISKIEANAFANQDLIQFVTIGNGVKEIGDSAFENDTGVWVIEIGNSLTKIGARAFYNCTSFSSLVKIASKKLNSIGKEAFKNKEKISVEAPKNCLSLYETLIKNSDKAKSLLVANTFYQVTNEKKKTVRCVSMAKQKAKVSIPSTVAADGTKYKVTEIGSNAFKDDKKLKKITIQSSDLTTIGSSAFQNCKKLKQLTIKSTKLKKVGKNAFKGCKMDVTVPPQKTDQYTKMFKGKW